VGANTRGLARTLEIAGASLCPLTATDADPPDMLPLSTTPAARDPGAPAAKARPSVQRSPMSSVLPEQPSEVIENAPSP
jgi:hypothetical protein